jgi:stage III sporulation protein AD
VKKMNMIQIGMIGVLGALLAIQFKGGKTEYGIYLSAAVSMLLFVCIVDRLELFVGTIEEISRYITIDRGYISTMLKMIGITYIAEFASGICKDTGYQTIAVQIEIFSKLTILAMGVPVLLALLETIQEFLL